MKFNKIVTERLIIKESTKEEENNLILNGFKYMGSNYYEESIFEKIIRVDNENKI